MPSILAWLDQSEAHQRKMREVIDLFSESDSRDELGIAIVRDAFSDLLFPGLSTIQTRARYFFFLPWIFEELEQRRVPSAHFAEKSREMQVRLSDALIRGGERDGVIGVAAREKIKRLPESVYWSGLASFGIRTVRGDIADYRRGIERFYRRLDAHRGSEADESIAHLPHNWHPGLPPAPKGFLDETSLLLTTAEADFLRERMLRTDTDSMLAWLVLEGRPVAESRPLPWLSDPGSVEDEIDGPLGERLRHARYFSEVIWGAPLLYNLMLAEEADRRSLQSASQGRVEHYRARLEEWRALLTDREQALAEIDRRRFWSLVRGMNPNSDRSRDFIDAWLDLAHSTGGNVADTPSARRLIEDREYRLKRGMARLNNPRQLELWGGAAGTERVNYRWKTARVMVNDIVAGLNDA